MATTDIQRLLLTWIAGSEAQGNLIFFVCSAWFLQESQQVRMSKVFRIVADVWVIHGLFLAVFCLRNWFALTAVEITKCLLPVTFALNWYITCYLLVYLIHPFLNKMIASLSQRQLLGVSLTMLTLYFGINFINIFIQGDLFYTSPVVVFITVYFTMAYCKKYIRTQNWKRNIRLLLVGVCGTIVLIGLTNLLGLFMDVFHDKVWIWCRYCSPFILLTAISLFYLFRRMNFYSGWINRLAGMTLLIYVIHENYLFRIYVRPLFWIQNHFGYEHFLLFDFAMAALLFGVSVLLAFVYQKFLQKKVHQISDGVLHLCQKGYGRLVDRLIAVK